MLNDSGEVSSTWWSEPQAFISLAIWMAGTNFDLVPFCFRAAVRFSYKHWEAFRGSHPVKGNSATPPFISPASPHPPYGHPLVFNRLPSLHTAWAYPLSLLFVCHPSMCSNSQQEGTYADSSLTPPPLCHLYTCSTTNKGKAQNTYDQHRIQHSKGIHFIKRIWFTFESLAPGNWRLPSLPNSFLCLEIPLLIQAS